MIEQIVYDLSDGSVRILPNGEDMPRGTTHDPLLFDTEEFHAYHCRFCDRVLRIGAVRGNSLVAWCCVGVDDNGMRAPYSAPFSLFYPQTKWHIEELCAAAEALMACARHIGCAKVRITLPPEFYSPEVINAEAAALWHAGFRVEHIEINHYFNLQEFESAEGFLPSLNRSGRKNYKRACSPDLHFEPLGTDKLDLAYAVIKMNRKQTGYPLRLSLSHIKDLTELTSSTIRCFGVRYGDELVAAAIVFDITTDISRVIYWGDNREYQLRRPMALLAMRLVEFYSRLGKRYLDIGISSLDGTINFGLSDFKRSIGCRNAARLTLQRDL